MAFFQMARRPPRWLRAALAVLLLAFALNALAHVSHRHDASPASATHGLACGYCVSFGGLAAAPSHEHVSALQRQVGLIEPPACAPAPRARPHTCAQPRAPPSH